MRDRITRWHDHYASTGSQCGARAQSFARAESARAHNITEKGSKRPRIGITLKA